MAGPIFVITIDTEGDNLWNHPESVTTQNARFVPRFHRLCEDYGFKPTYLVTYEMAMDPHFQDFGRSVVRKGAGEIGLHLHPWHSAHPGTPSAIPGYPIHRAYVYELPEELIYAKCDFLTRLLTDVFETRPVSHRAGRWGFDARIARILASLNYLVDCSVTPNVSWKKYKGARDGQAGPDYFGFPLQPYFLDLNNIREAGSSTLLEVPVTIKPNYHPSIQRYHHRVEDRLAGKVLRRFFGPPCTWLRPNGHNLDAIHDLVDWALQRRLPVLEFMLHSSELMPGGSPTFTTAEEVDLLYGHLRQLFARLASAGVSSMTLAEYRSSWS